MLRSDVARVAEEAAYHAKNRTPLPLHAATGGWTVRDGHVDLFAIEVRGGAPVSRRRHLLRVHQDELLPAAGESVAGFELLAIPAKDTRLVEISRGGNQELLAEQIDRWVEQLAGSAITDLPPKEHEAPPPCGDLFVQGGASVRSPGGVAWVRHLEGQSHFMGDAALPALDAGQPPVPVGRNVWFETACVCRLATASTLDRLRGGELWSDLRAFHRLVLAGLASQTRRSESDESARLLRRMEADQAVLTDAFSHLASVMQRPHAAAAASSDPLLSACRLVGEAMHVEITPPLHSNATERRDRLAEIARASRIRTRRVALRGAWWRLDSGPLLGLVVSTEDDARRPVALLFAESQGYVLHDPSGTTCRVDETVAETLHPFAFSFYRPFRDGALGAWDVFRFGADGCRRDFWLILLMGIAAGLLGMITPIVTGVVFNRVIPEADRLLLTQVIFALAAGAMASGLFQLVRGLAVLRVESNMDASVQSAVWDRLLNLPTAFFRQFAAGELAVRAGGISGIRQLLSGATISSVLSGLFSVFNLALLFYYDARLALWALGLTALALGITVAVSYFQLRYHRTISEKQSKLSGTVLQFITGITKLRVAGAETKAFEMWARDFSAQRHLQFRARRLGNGLSSFNSVFPVLSMMIIFAAMILRENVAMSIGDFIAFNAALGTFAAHMLSMTGAFVAILMAIPIYEQARPILEALPEIDATKTDPGALTGEIEVQHLSFRYDADGAPVLHDVSLHARAGEMVALVGPSGSGKSTILRLLLGFEEPEAGSIYYDGQDLACLDIQAVRRQIGVVLQNGRLMSGDLFTNIVGSSTATMDDAWQASRMAALDEDIKQMPMGMHTVVSDGGTTLSGGQRQRLMVARAIVGRPRMLFFDEATSALDNRTQAIVSESLKKLQATRIVVAHRLTTISGADRIYVVEGGRIAQQGTYERLLQEGGVFGELVRRQMI